MTCQATQCSAVGAAIVFEDDVANGPTAKEHPLTKMAEFLFSLSIIVISVGNATMKKKRKRLKDLAVAPCW